MMKVHLCKHTLQYIQMALAFICTRGLQETMLSNAMHTRNNMTRIHKSLDRSSALHSHMKSYTTIYMTIWKVWTYSV